MAKNAVPTRGPVRQLLSITSQLNHAIGIGALLLPFVMFRVGIVQFGLLLFFSAILKINFQSIIFKLANGNGTNPSKLLVAVHTKRISKVVAKCLFIVDCFICTGTYLIAIDEILLPLMPYDVPDPINRFGIQLLVSLVACTIILVWIILEDSALEEDRPRCSTTDNKNQDQDTEVPRTKDVTNIRSSYIKYLKIASGGFNYMAAKRRILNYRRLRNMQLGLFMLLFASVTGIWSDHEIHNSKTAVSKSDERQLNITCAYAIISYAFKCYTVMVAYRDGSSTKFQSAVHETRTQDIVRNQFVMMILYFAFALLVTRPMERVEVNFVTNYGNNTIGGIISVLALCFVTASMLLRFIPCCQTINALIFDATTDASDETDTSDIRNSRDKSDRPTTISRDNSDTRNSSDNSDTSDTSDTSDDHGISDTNDDASAIAASEAHWVVALALLFCSLMAKFLFGHVVNIIVFAVLVTNNVLKSIPVISFCFSKRDHPSKDMDKWIIRQARFHLFIHMLLLIAGVRELWNFKPCQ